MNGYSDYRQFGIPFDQYQRYKTVERIINLNRDRSKKFSILEVGANEHRNLELFLPTDDIYYLDIKEPSVKIDNFILDDATEMSSIKDNSFDIVIALDVFEHIDTKKRKDFLKEINRVKKRFFILANPFDSLEVREAEIELNNFYKSKYGEDHIWLKEHIDKGLPHLDETLSYISEYLNCNFGYFSYGSLNIWKKLMKLHFDVERNKELEKLIRNIDLFYNMFIYPYDKDINNYRHFIIGGEFNSSSILDFKNISYIPSHILEYLDISIQNLSNRNRYIQVFFAEENSYFKEENSIKYDLGSLKSNSINLSIKIDPDIKRIRLDPLNSYVIVKVSFSPKKYISLTNTNAEIIEDDIFYFLTDDPQIEFLIKDRVNYLNLELEFLEMERCSVLERIIDKKNKKIDEQKAQIKELSEGDNIWKKLKGIIGRLF